MSYATKKAYGIELGFVFTEGGKEFVVVDVITHRWNSTVKLHEALPEPLVVYRPLIFKIEIHERDIMELTEFKKYLKPTT